MSPRVTVAIPDLAGEVALARTLAALSRQTPEPYEVVVLAESNAPASFAAPTALNQLLRQGDTPYVLLLESGALVSAGWLGRLLAPLDDPATGLSGPSTNLCWNEQQVTSPGLGLNWGPEHAEAYAGQVAERFGEQAVALDTLHSLADFCYLVRREVALELGGFDEAYGTGPCWEIDFNTRAARAGYRAVWVCGAYVHRTAPPLRRAQAMQRAFAAAKQLYQDRFCGLRLRGEKGTYEPHCRGQACEHFAPSGLIRVRLELDERAGPERRAELSPSLSPPAEPSQAEPAPGSASTAVPEALPPLVTCIMPTRDRADYVLQSIRYFQRQDYPHRELLILDDGADDLAGRLEQAGALADPRLRYVRVEAGLSLGAKRNRAVELARGEIIAQWDDDDWYANGRLSAQIAPLLAGEADISGLEAGLFFELEPWRFWRCSPALHRRLFVGDVHGGSLVYRRDVWARLARYPGRAVAEDALFLRAATARGARLCRLPNDGLYIYLRHGANAWAFSPGRYLDPRGWQPASEPLFPPGDRAFYAARSRAVTASATLTGAAGRPLVSCIMPTAGRRVFVGMALAYFARQDYPQSELVVVDDGAEPVADLMPDDPAVRYLRLDPRQSVGAKRNLACEAARGELILHWDDDDWMAPDRISRQVAALLGQGADVCGLDRVLYYEPAHGRGWEYVYPPGGRPWVGGNTLCYRRDMWRRNPFPAIDVGEDNRFLWSGRAGKIVAIPGGAFLVGLIHPQNTSAKRTQDPRWRMYPLESLQRLMGTDWLSYAA